MISLLLCKMSLLLPRLKSPFSFQLDEKELALNQQKKETRKVVRRLRSQISQGEDKEQTAQQRKRSHERRDEDDDDEDGQGGHGGAGFKGVGSRIAEMEARTKRLRH